MLHNTITVHATRLTCQLSLSCLFIVSALVLCGLSSDYFTAIDGLLCVNSQYVESHPEESTELRCAYLCSLDLRCQAFSLADGPCRLFVFNACSKAVRDCSCSRRGRVFVKQRWPGLLEPGALCPTGYSDDRCGVKYRLYTDSLTWHQGRQKCESESGHVIMADVADAAELSHLEAIKANKSAAGSVWLGGFQPAGSPEPLGGWYWIGCNVSIDAGLWASEEPNNGNGGDEEAALCLLEAVHGVLDLKESLTGAVLCECVDPF